MSTGAWIAMAVVGLVVAWIVIGCICSFCKRKDRGCK